MVLRSELPVLDECGHVYVAGGGPAGECLRLNASASRLWRGAVGSLDEAAVAGLPEPSRRFLENLLARGVLGWRDR
ncbi:hypothetical protein ACFY41_00770 [Streptomyces syringium]|uniref:Coenzyme PQQ synthesis protein D (PqqD) n=1 Tax=Streptomyces syringium TaxID=76729 RepID=A0ABS4XYK7_9ACTN|nr:hypothetical protein [Streptomyces syringium]MBP2401322.1 hypothetical protein [Streptomyces syringium]